MFKRTFFAAGLIAFATACSGGGSTSTVTPPPPPPPAVASVSVALGSGSLVAGQSTAASATTLDGSGNILTGRAITWSTSNASVASVSTSGLVQAISAGNVNIIALSEGKSGSAPLSVTPLIVPVATVNVSLGSSTIVAGQTTTATAVTLDGSGNPLSGRTITWSSSNVAIANVSTAGAVQAVSAGTASIIATSEGKTGSSTLTVVAPITSVTLNGSTRDKVGDTYAYTVTEKLGDGTVVQRPATWSVTPSNAATITSGGLLTPLMAGSVSVVITIDGVPWNAAVTAYDWVVASSPGIVGAGLDADTPVINFLGVSEFPSLVVGCDAGTFVVGVSFTGIITATGLVTYSGDNGNIIQETWLESPPDFNNLVYPGLTNLLRKSFATALATNHLFNFAFTEFVSSTHVTTWRLTGMSAAIAPALAACPGNALRAPDSTTMAHLAAAVRRPGTPNPALAIRSLQRAHTPASTIAAPLKAALRAPEQTPMRRAPR